MSELNDNEPDIDPPPFFKTWSGMYGLVIGTLIALVVIFYLFSRYFE